MMETLHRGVISLVKSAITGESCALPEGFDLEDAERAANRHHIVPLVYVGALNCACDRNSPVMQRLFKGYCGYLLAGEKQLKMIERLFKAFDESEIEYLPLKGCRLKKLYPSPEMRPMGDADILIKIEQYEKIRSTVASLGFTERLESDHELIWESEVLHLELHKRLIPSYNKDYYRFFGDGWRLAVPESGTRFGMRPEDEFVYLFTHFAKHYRDGGIGIRHVADLWVYRRAHPAMDGKCIINSLESLGLAQFYKNTLILMDVWFGDGQGDEKSDIMSGFILNSGSWGNAENHALADGVRAAEDSGSVRKGQLKLILQAVFPDVKSISARYPVLKRAPYLLPLIWPVRWVTSLLFRRDNIKRRRDAFKTSTGAKVNSYREMLDFVGLNFNFKENEQ